MATSYPFIPIVTDGLVLYLDPINTKSYSGSGTSSYDLKGNLLGELVNGVGFSNKSFTFDGSDDYIDYGIPSIFTGTDITIDIFLNLDTLPNSYNDIIDYDHGNGGFVIQRDGTSDDFYFAYYSGAGSYGGYEIFWFTLGGVSIPTGIYTHISVVKDSTSIYLYRNGVDESLYISPTHKQVHRLLLHYKSVHRLFQVQ